MSNLDRGQLIYRIIEKKVGNYRTDRGLRYLKELQSKSTVELNEMYAKLYPSDSKRGAK